MTWTEHAYQRFRDQERLDYVQFLTQQDEANTRLQEATMSSTHKTRRGDRVPRFPDVSDRDARIAEVRDRMAEAYDTAQVELDRQRRMESTSTVDRSRFPAIKGGA